MGRSDPVLRLQRAGPSDRLHNNAIESLNSSVRRAIRNKGHFPNDEAATKLIWLALRNIAAKWNNPPIYWHAAKVQLAIQFEERFVLSE